MNKETKTIIDLIRHGEPDGGRMIRGHTIDHPLSEKGWSQMRHAVDGHCPWSVIVTSPMKRCVEFANELASKHQLDVEIEHDLREVGFGSWEGHTPDELIASNPDEYYAFYENPVTNRPAGAEPLDGFMRRTVSAYQQVVDRHQGKQILIVCHAGVMRSLIAHTLHAEALGMYRIQVDNAGISRIEHGKRGPMLTAHNASIASLTK